MPTIDHAHHSGRANPSPGRRRSAARASAAPAARNALPAARGRLLVHDARSALALQRTAGNRATVAALSGSRPVVQRDEITLASGSRFADRDAPGVNVRDDVLTVMD